ncbi:MAG: hypothetical protein ABJD68_17935, partial [Nakamurella sp.]
MNWEGGFDDPATSLVVGVPGAGPGRTSNSGPTFGFMPVTSRLPAGLGDGLFVRAPGNPLLTPSRWPYPVNAVLNPGATLVGRDTVLLCRVEDRR